MTEEQILHEVDDTLLLLTKKLNLLKYLTPTNVLTERERFVERKGNYDPQFNYNFPKEEEITWWIQGLEHMKIEYFNTKTYENPISKLLLDKIEENILIAKLVLAYSEQDFSNIEKYNEQLFGSFDQKILQQAEEILQSYQEPKAELRWDMLTGNEIQQYVLDYLQTHHIDGVEIVPVWQLAAKFAITFGKGGCRLSYVPTMKIRQYALEADLIHELWVHYTRYLNGKATGWNILTFWTKNYLTDEEGLAIYQVCAYKKTRYPAFQKTGSYEKYLLLHYGQGKSFREMATYIQERRRSKNLTTIFTMVMRCKLGIQDTSSRTAGNGFLKNKLYTDGFHRITDRIAQWHHIDELLQAKIGIDDLSYIWW
jgi:hypothetical protein